MAPRNYVRRGCMTTSFSMVDLPMIETNEKPIQQEDIEILLGAGFNFDLILDFDLEINAYLIYVKYHNKTVIRQVYSQRKKPRAFKDIKRAIDWGKKIGFKTVSTTIKYSDYPE